MLPKFLVDFFSDSSPRVSSENPSEVSYRIPGVYTGNIPAALLEYPPGVYFMISTGSPPKYLPEVPSGNPPKVLP